MRANVYVDETELLHITVMSEKKMENGDNLISSEILILGIMRFNVNLYVSEINFLSGYIPLKKKKINRKTLDALKKITPEIEFSEFPLKNIIYLFSSNNGQNLYKFYLKTLKLLDDNNISDPTKRLHIILNNLIKNRDIFLEYFNILNKPLYNFIFNSKSIYTKHNRFFFIKSFLPIDNSHGDFIYYDDYNRIRSFNELYNFVCSNKKIKFQKDLERLLYKNMVNSINLNGNESSMINVDLFERIRLIFSLDESENIKSFKEFSSYLNIIEKLSLGDKGIFVHKSLNIRSELLKFLNSFNEKPLIVLKKMNIPYHLIKSNNNLLDKFYENSQGKLSIANEKKLYYFLEGISKRVSENVENFTLENNNKGFNQNPIKYKDKTMEIYTIKNFNELKMVGMRLSNCAGNYETIDVYKNKHNNIAKDFYGNKEFLFLIENGEIKEFKGFKNTSPTFDFFVSVYEKLFLLGYLKPLELNEKLQDVYEKVAIHKIWID